MGCGFSRERKNSASERSYLRRRSSAAACLSVFSGCLLFLPRHPRTAFGIPAPVCSVRFAFPEASRPCGPRIVPPACTAALFCSGTPEPLPVSRRPSVPSDSLFRKPPGPAAPIDRKRLLSGLRIGPPACTATLFGPGARLLRPIRFSGSLPALRPQSTASACFPACESCLPSAPPLSSAPAPLNRLRYPGARLLRPIRFSGSLPALRPRTPEPLSVSRRPSASSGTGRTRKAPTLREKCRGIRRSGRSAHPCGPRHGYSAPPVADGAFSVHRCFSISTNHSGQRHGRRVSLRMNPSTVDPVLSSSPRSFRIS